MSRRGVARVEVLVVHGGVGVGGVHGVRGCRLLAGVVVPSQRLVGPRLEGGRPVGMVGVVGGVRVGGRVVRVVRVLGQILVVVLSSVVRAAVLRGGEGGEGGEGLVGGGAARVDCQLLLPLDGAVLADSVVEGVVGSVRTVVLTDSLRSHGGH